MITITYVLDVKISMKAANVEFLTSMLWKEAANLLQLSLNCLIILLIFSNLWTSWCCLLWQWEITWGRMNMYLYYKEKQISNTYIFICKNNNCEGITISACQVIFRAPSLTRHIYLHIHEINMRQLTTLKCKGKSHKELTGSIRKFIIPLDIVSPLIFMYSAP